MESSVMVAGLNQPAHYLDWGPVQISVANLIVICLIIVLFAVAIALPFPGSNRTSPKGSSDTSPKGPEKA